MKPSDDLPIYPIRTVASLSGVDARRLRSWEVEYQLLRPARTKGGHRLYSTRDLRLVQAIRRLVEEEGMSLQGVRAWLAAQPDQVDGDETTPRPRAPEPAGAMGAGNTGRRGE
ncbi:MAG TPA: MerR family transcriptional regulator [bacterium]